MQLLKKIKRSLYFNVFLHALEMGALFCCVVFPAGLIFFIVMSSVLTILLIPKIEGLCSIHRSIWKSLFSKRLTLDNPASHRLFSIVENVLLMSLLYFWFCPYTFGISASIIIWLKLEVLLATVALYMARPLYDFFKHGDAKTKFGRFALFSILFILMMLVVAALCMDVAAFFVLIIGVFLIGLYSVYFYGNEVKKFITKLEVEVEVEENELSEYPKISNYLKAMSAIDLWKFNDDKNREAYPNGRSVDQLIERGLQIPNKDKSDLLGFKPAQTF